MSLTTNGMLLDKEKVKYLTDNHISLILSLDGRKEMHDSMRPGVNNEGTYDRIMKNLQYCIKHRNGEEYYVRGTFTRQNLDFTTDVEDMLNHGFPVVSMEPVVGDDTADYSIKESDLPRVKDEYDKLAKFFIKREEEGNPFFSSISIWIFGEAPACRSVFADVEQGMNIWRSCPMEIFTRATSLSVVKDM